MCCLLFVDSCLFLLFVVFTVLCCDVDGGRVVVLLYRCLLLFVCLLCVVDR